MARTGSGALLSRRNVKLDSFLKRNTARAVYERIRAHEPCVVITETINKVYMHVVLSDECVYLAEYPPRTLTEAFTFRRVRDIELVNDLPDFLHGRNRDLCQHIRVTYVTDKPAVRGRDWLRRDWKVGLPTAAPPSRRTSHCPAITYTLEGHPAQRSPAELPPLPPSRSASCPDPETLGLVGVPHPPDRPPSATPSAAASPTSPLSPASRRLHLPDTTQVPRRIGSVLSRLLRKDSASGGEEREAELHFYAVSDASRLYLHLQSSWNSFIIRSTLSLDPLHRTRCSASSDSGSGKRLPAVSWERTAHLFGQLSCELLQEGISVESLYLLLQELRTAAQRDVTLRRLFWNSSELLDFLVQTLEESLHGRQSLSGASAADQLLLSTLIAQTLALMFRETEVEPARLNLLSAKKGVLASRMLRALMCDAELRTQDQRSLTDGERQALLAEYLDAACSLLFELLLLGHDASRCSSADHFLSVGWILRVLQPLPQTLSFIGYQVQQVVLVLSDPQDSFLSPLQSVVLFQRCRLLLACLQYNEPLAQHLRSHFREEFRYSVKLSCAEEKLPPHYPISRPTLHLVEQILALHRHR